jgi:crotonobetainyl-CoA hydratase
MAAVRTEVRGGVLEVVLDRPKANAIDRATGIELHEAFVRLRDDDDLRVAILTGAGERFFSAGWDLKAAAAGEEDTSTDFGPGGFAGLTEMFELDKPVVAAVNGLAAGGGFELVLACDLIVAADHAELFLPELSLGIVPDAGGAQRLPRRLPWFLAMELLLTSRRLRRDRGAATRPSLLGGPRSGAHGRGAPDRRPHRRLPPARRPGDEGDRPPGRGPLR